MNNHDDDNENLTYRVYRDTQNAAGLKHTVSREFNRWETVTMGFTDTNVPAGSHQYRVVVTDPFGNVANSSWTPSPWSPRGTDSDYLKAVYASQPTNYWRMGEATGTTASADRVGFMPLSATGTTVPVRGEAGAIANDDRHRIQLHRCQHQLDDVRGAALAVGHDDPRGLVQDHGRRWPDRRLEQPQHAGQLQTS